MAVSFAHVVRFGRASAGVQRMQGAAHLPCPDLALEPHVLLLVSLQVKSAEPVLSVVLAQVIPPVVLMHAKRRGSGCCPVVTLPLPEIRAYSSHACHDPPACPTWPPRSRAQVILGETYPYYVWLSLLPIIAGCSLAAMKEVRRGKPAYLLAVPWSMCHLLFLAGLQVSFAWSGFNNAMVSNIGMVLRNIYSKKFLGQLKVCCGRGWQEACV